MVTGLGTTGRWQVTTVTSVYLIDLNAMTAVRVPDAGPGSLPGDPIGWYPAPLRRDYEPVPILAVDMCLLGERMLLCLDIRGDGIVTFRNTTPVTDIRQLHPEQGS